MFGKFVHQQHWIEKTPRWVGWTRARIKLFTINLICRDLILTTMVICFFTGIEGDIYYIRDGQIKLNAVNLNMTVPYRVNCLRFIWFSKPMVSIFNTTWRSRCSVFVYKHSLNGKVVLLCHGVCQCFNHPSWSCTLMSWSCTLWKFERHQTYYLFSMRFYNLVYLDDSEVEPLLISLMISCPQGVLIKLTCNPWMVWMLTVCTFCPLGILL